MGGIRLFLHKVCSLNFLLNINMFKLILDIFPNCVYFAQGWEFALSHVSLL